MRKYINKVISICAAFVMGIMGLLFTVAPANYTAKAEEAGSHVMDDLQSDTSFDASAYPEKSGDYSLQVIQIAESTDKELLVYVYQPSAAERGIKASSINISTAIDGAEGYDNYDLRYLNSDGVFFKYAVEGLTLREDVLRFYSITAIYRPYDGEIDSAPNDDNTIEQKAFKVGQLWTATTYENTVLYACRYLDLITIEEKHIGFIRYRDGGIFFSQNTDSHYVAFSTDRKIDDLLEVEMQYTKQAKSTLAVSNTLTGKTTYSTTDNGEPEKVNLTLKDEDVFQGGGGIFSSVYKYNRIQTITEFMNTEELSDDTISALDGTEWVLRFAETEYTTKVLQTLQYQQDIMTYHTKVTGVVIFRMEFIYDGVVYNMGVVDNISSGDSNPDNKYWDPNTSLPDWLIPEDGKGLPWWVWLIIAVVVILALIFIKPLIAVISYLCTDILLPFIKWLGKALWWLISAPVRFVIWIVKKIRGDYD